MNKLIYPAVIVTALLVTSCSLQEPDVYVPANEQKEVIISASVENDSDGTKTILYDEADVYWKPKDQIKVFCGGAGAKFTSVNTTPVSTANFSGIISVVSGTNESISDSYIWGLYPYRDKATYKNGTITTTLPSKQTGAAGTFADDLLITMGRSLNLSIPFYNVCTGIRFTLTKEGVKYVTLTANGGEPIAGTFSMGIGPDGRPKVIEVTEASSSVTVTAPDAGTFETGVWYYIVTLPVTFSKGVTFTVSNGTLKGSRSISSPFSLSRGAFSRSTGLDKNIELNEVDDTETDAYNSADDRNTPLCIEVVETDYTAAGCALCLWGVPELDEDGQGLEYSTDGKYWKVISQSETKKYRPYSFRLHKGDKIYLRCNNLRYGKSVPEAPSTSYYPPYLTAGRELADHLNIYVVDGKACVYGNVMSLVDKENFASKTEIDDPYIFYGLFADDDVEAYHQWKMRYSTETVQDSNTPVIRSGRGICFSSGRKLILPATKLSEYCYGRMFAGCKEIESSPELPATELSNGCYSEMFENCTGLVSAPKLPAETLAAGCYSGMFYGSGVLSSPALPARTLFPGCYAYMLANTPIYKSPELPATVLSDWCYTGLFSGCSNLQETPELPATELCESCYSSIFENCTGIKEAKPLPITTLATSCYSSMYRGTSITAAPALPATELVYGCYTAMFSDCKQLKTPPALPAKTLAIFCYQSMFSNCTSLTQAPELPASELAEYCYRDMFSGCERLVVPPALPATELKRNCYDYMFLSSGIVTAPELPATVLAVNCYYSMFESCRDLKNAPELSAATLENYCYQNMFKDCTSLEVAPELPATVLAQGCYGSMFDGCTSLVQAPSCLPVGGTKTYFSYMFRGCTSLERAPVLSSTEQYRGSGMFEGCISLKYLKCNSLSYFSGTINTWLLGVNSTGTFVKNAECPDIDFGQPAGWTVVSESM